MALTVAVYFIGATTNGAARWIPLGPFQFQPSEALKVATVLFLARQLAGRQSKIDKIRIVPTWRFWTWRSSPEQRKIWREGTWPILMPVAVSALVIFPALSAMRLFQNFRSVTVCSAVLSVSCAVLGILISSLAGTPVGSTIVAVDILAFLICSVLGRVRGGKA